MLDQFEVPTRVPTFAHFGLPAEITIQIIELAVRQCNAQIIPIRRSDVNGELYSTVKAPALIHVNYECRNIALKEYKPWLSLFKGTKAHRPYEALVKKKGVAKISCLQNVLINLEHDTLLLADINITHFGQLEYCHLRSLCINMEGYLCFLKLVRTLRKFKNLRTLRLYDSKDTGGLSYKVDHVTALLRKEQEKDEKKPRKRIPNYVLPVIEVRLVKGYRRTKRVVTARQRSRGELIQSSDGPKCSNNLVSEHVSDSESSVILTNALLERRPPHRAINTIDAPASREDRNTVAEASFKRNSEDDTSWSKRQPRYLENSLRPDPEARANESKKLVAVRKALWANKRFEDQWQHLGSKQQGSYASNKRKLEVEDIARNTRRRMTLPEHSQSPRISDHDARTSECKRLKAVRATMRAENDMKAPEEQVRTGRKPSSVRKLLGA
jgi:hypothetical protein